MNPFEECLRRIDRSTSHGNAATKIWSNFDQNSVYRTFARVKSDGTGVVFVEPVLGDWSLELAFELGEMLYHLRAALDSVVYQAAILISGESPPPNEQHLAFPISSTAKEFQNASRYIAPLPKECRNFIKRLQPYNSPPVPDQIQVWMPHRALGILNHWARIDRHRRLHIIGCLPTDFKPEFDLPPGMNVAYTSVAPTEILTNKRIEVATLKIDGWRKNTESSIETKLTLIPAVVETPPCCESDTLGNRLSVMTTTVATIVRWFEMYFDR